MRVTGLRKVFLIFRLVVTSLSDALRVTFGSILLKNSRAYIDRVIHVWARDLLDVVKVEVKVFNPNNFQFDPDKPYIIMSNHASHFDIPLVYRAFPNESIRMVAKKELFRIPVFGRGMREGGCISIDRVNKRQAIKDLKHAVDAMLSGIRVWIAPEGTRSDTGEMGVFKKGGFKIAMDAKAIIVPIAIVGSNKILPTKTLDISLNAKVEIYICDPIDTKNYQGTDLKKLMSDAKSVIQANL